MSDSLIVKSCTVYNTKDNPVHLDRSPDPKETVIFPPRGKMFMNFTKSQLAYLVAVPALKTSN